MNFEHPDTHMSESLRKCYLIREAPVAAEPKGGPHVSLAPNSALLFFTALITTRGCYILPLLPNVSTDVSGPSSTSI